jgi:hypothetical protein
LPAAPSLVTTLFEILDLLGSLSAIGSVEFAEEYTSAFGNLTSFIQGFMPFNGISQTSLDFISNVPYFCSFIGFNYNFF